MNQELEDKLYNEFPKLYPSWYALFCGFECGDGWFDLLWELSEKIVPLLDDRDEMPNYCLQVKEKYGRLCFYMNFSTEKIDDILEEFEDKSSHICEECGKEGKTRGGRWVRTVCDEHQ